MRNSQLASIAGQILSSRLIDIVREKEGAVYSIWATGSLDRIGTQNASLSSQFPMKPQMREKVLGTFSEQIADMSRGITAAELAKAKEYMAKKYAADREENSEWIAQMAGTAIDGIDCLNGNLESLDSITEADVAAFVKTMTDQGNYRVVILDPEQ